MLQLHGGFLRPCRLDLTQAIARPLKIAQEAPRGPSARARVPDASMERRRRWAASGRLPPGIAARLTLAEQAVLSLVAAEVAQALWASMKASAHCRIASRSIKQLYWELVGKRDSLGSPALVPRTPGQ